MPDQSKTYPSTFEFEFLGTGTSTGIPIPSCPCPVCHSDDPRDTRWRSSALIRHNGQNIIIDSGPEFRLQCLRANVESLDGVLITHSHADHINGLDDIRAYTLPLYGTTSERLHEQPMGLWGNAPSIEAIRKRFSYIWNPLQVGGGLPKLQLTIAPEEFELAGLSIRPIPIKHGIMEILGYRIGQLAYMTDISQLPDSSEHLVEDVDVMVISFVTRHKHETHFCFDDAVRLHQRIRPKQTYITHVAHYFSHQDLLDQLPEGMTPAYDGLRLQVPILDRT